MRKILIWGVIGLLIIGAGIGIYMTERYQAGEVMAVPLEELAPDAYPDDPANRSARFGDYAGRELTLVRRSDTLFDFIFTSDDPKVATIAFRDVDLSLYMPVQPASIIGDRDLEVVYYTEREWNRQQVGFSPRSKNVEVTGGDGFEKRNLTALELARNCLNAGLWEVQLFVEEAGEKALYYHGWFTFPLGHYQDLFGKLNPVSYWSYWYRVEHWWSAEGTPVNFEKLRTVGATRNITVKENEPLVPEGEQARKKRLVNGDMTFATFEKPGRYNMSKPWKNEFERLAVLKEALLKEITAPDGKKLQELELVFQEGKTRLIMGGIDLSRLPRLAVSDYSKGLFLPFGIAMPPFYQTYEELQQDPPQEKPNYTLLVDEKNQWLNHHEIAIDGAVLFRDLRNPSQIHLLLLSYERHAIIAHYILSITQPGVSVSDHSRDVPG